jgi:putative transposase
MLGWRLALSGKASTTTGALEHALTSRHGILGKVTREFLLRSDNGLVFTSRKSTVLVRSYGLKQVFIWRWT